MSSGEAPTAGLIFLHGSGDNGAGVRDWLSSCSMGDFERRLSAAGVKMVYPDAPRVPYTLAGGGLQSVWFDRVGMAYNAPEDAAGMAKSLEQVDSEIDQLIAAGIPRSRIAVGGMSMGGCLALHAAYGNGRHAGAIAAAACLSSFLAEDSGLDAACRARSAGAGSGEAGAGAPALFMAHGEADGMIQPAWAQRTRERLEACGVPVPSELLMFPGVGHELCQEEVKLLADFLLRHLSES